MLLVKENQVLQAGSQTGYRNEEKRKRSLHLFIEYEVKNLISNLKQKHPKQRAEKIKSYQI